MRKIQYISLWIFSFTLFTACKKDLLDIENPNEPTTETFWKTEDDAQKGINAAYSRFYKEGTWMRWLSFRYDLSSDEGWSTSPWNELGDWTRFNYVNYNFFEGNNVHWQDFYVGIFRANQVLKYVPDIPFADEENKKLILAQAQFLRALWYFQIAILWEKGALVLEPTEAGYVPEESSEEAIWAQVEKDLQESATVLPEKWGDDDLGRATAGAAKALLAKAYMQQHKYAEAMAELKWLIDKEGTLYGLMDEYLDNFTHYKENNKESIFEIQFDDKNKGGTGEDASMATGFQRTQFYAPSPVGWQDGKARPWFINEYKKEKNLDGANDIRLYYNLYYSGSAADFPEKSPLVYGMTWQKGNWGDQTYVRKYSTGYYREVEDYFAPNNYRLIRYADILLMYAECIAETGGSLTDAASYVNKVRQRPSVNLPSLQNSIYKDVLNSKAKFLKHLQMERTLELCFEGWRWIDLKRWGMLDTQEGINELKSRDADFNNFIIGKHNRLPIPQIEVDNSGGKFTQNPKY
ncbi:RagB/SusD family nutrient uptake outer membrane protein [Olivibacter ginsenosidimutans]|uniref:RagB/SusD family nutrient uptake outer membrane protein n=1 Tax=Olivibacter ginsenosidimutans TaxID=1176537 RepID=A0ABP9BHU0_9SPHI